MSKLGWHQPIDIQDTHKTISTRDLRQNLAEVLSFTAQQKVPVVLTKNGAEHAAIIPVEELLFLDLLNRKVSFREIIQKYVLGGYDADGAWEELKLRVDRLAHEEKQAAEGTPDGQPDDHSLLRKAS